MAFGVLNFGRLFSVGSTKKPTLTLPISPWNDSLNWNDANIWSDA